MDYKQHKGSLRGQIKNKVERKLYNKRIRAAGKNVDTCGGQLTISKICKYCNKPIPDNDKLATYGDGTFGCSKCERSIDTADMNPWKNDNSYCS